MKKKRLILIFVLCVALPLFIIFVGPSLGIKVLVNLAFKWLFKVNTSIATTNGDHSISYGLSLLKRIFWFLLPISAIAPPTPFDAIELAPLPENPEDNPEDQRIILSISSDETEVGSLGEELTDTQKDVGEDCCLISCLVGIGRAIDACARGVRFLYRWWTGDSD